MMFIEAGSEYAKAWIDGETNGKVDTKVLEEKFKEYAKTDIQITTLDEGGKKYDNYFLVLLDYLDF